MQKSGYSLNIEIQENSIKITPNKTTKDAGDIYHSNDLFMNDLSITHSCADGWLYLIDQSRDTAGKFNDYYFNNIQNLMQGKSVTVEMDSIEKDYQHYDFASI